MNDPISEIPSAWSVYLPVVATMFRAFLIVAGSLGFAWAKNVTGDQIQMAAYAALGLAAVIWSGWTKIQTIHAARKLAIAAAVASAAATQAAGTPTPVIPNP